VRETIKYQPHDDVMLKSPSGQTVTPSLTTGPEAVKEFRAQRNLYISGISLFLAFVIKRLVVLLDKTATLIEDCESHARKADAYRIELNESMSKRISENAKNKMSDDLTDDLKKNINDDGQEAPARSRSRVKKEM
jgi:hypothetical protein